MDCEIVPAELAVKSMRDNGYKNAAYAIAELIDNSIQAEATKIELLIGEKFTYKDRLSSNLDVIAVLDNGNGMSPETLQIALQFGNGTHLEKVNQDGIGKFGMGLPAASISQCRKVEVYTWKDGPASAFYTYIDIDEITQKKMKAIPKPIKQEIPKEWQDCCNIFGNSGTLILWSKIDRCHWKKGNTIIRHSELLIGRIYRRFLKDEKVSIRMLTFDVEGDQKDIEKFAKPNDPLYLMKNTSCPSPWNNEPMFEKWYETTSHFIKFRDETHEVKVTYSIAKKETRSIPNAGDKPHGKHAKANIGLSIMRSDREITLDSRWAIQYDPRERWWGIEVDFPPALDEVFGLTNNKQSAATFEDLAIENLKEIDSEDFSLSEYKRDLEENNDPAASLIDLVTEINNNLVLMRKKVVDQKKGSKTSKEKRSSSQNAEDDATQATDDRKVEGYEGISDKDEFIPTEERRLDLTSEFVEQGFSEDEAKKIAETILGIGTKYHFETMSLETAAFFSVRPKAGIIVIYINSDHPAYNHLIELISYEPNDSESLEDLKYRMSRAKDSLFLLLAAWARYEDEQLNDKIRDKLKDIRNDWGRIARDFLRSND